MNNTQHNDVQSELIDLFLSYIEEVVSTEDTLVRAEEICQKNTIDKKDKNLLAVSDKIIEIRKNYDHRILTEDDARYEITTLLILLTHLTHSSNQL